MPKITFEQREKLRLGIEVKIDIAAKTISLTPSEKLDPDGAEFEAVYARLQRFWQESPDLACEIFPIVYLSGFLLSGSNKKYRFVDGWQWANTETEALIKNGEWVPGERISDSVQKVIADINWGWADKLAARVNENHI